MSQSKQTKRALSCSPIQIMFFIVFELFYNSLSYGKLMMLQNNSWKPVMSNGMQLTIALQVDQFSINLYFYFRIPNSLCVSLLFETLFLFFLIFLFFPFICISWRLITLQYCSGFCHTLTRISHGFTCIPDPDPLSHLPLHPIPLGLPSAPGLSTCLMHPTWAGDLFHPC